MHSNHHLDAALAAARQDRIADRRMPARPQPQRLRATITRWISFVPS